MAPATPPRPPDSARRGAWRVTFAYALLAACWILFSDQILAWMVGGPTAYEFATWGTLKGMVFVLVTSTLLWVGIHRSLRRIERLREQEQEHSRHLAKAKEVAEAANSAKDRFLAVLSHELRTPLTPVLAILALWERDQNMRAAAGADLHTLRRNIELEARLIDDLLDLTRILHGKLELYREPVDLARLVREAAAICQPDAQNKHITLTLTGMAGPVYVRGDAGRLMQVLWNLLKNAIKFTPAHGRIGVCCHTASDVVHLTVSDDGIGIDPAALGTIFDAFNQGAQDTTRRYGGLGLGLAISRAIAGLHDGSLSAASPGQGQGATFTLQLPQCSAPAAPAAARPAPTTEPKGRTILLVEDHPDTAKVLARLLDRLGYHVRVANTVADALVAVGQDRFDLLVSDIGLPDGNGVDLMRAIQTIQPLRGIALSGFGMDDDVRRSLDAGFFAHLTKPVDLARLDQALREALAPAEDPLHAKLQRI